MNDTKICRTCQKEKPVTEYWIANTRNGKTSYKADCKDCIGVKTPIAKQAKKGKSVKYPIGEERITSTGCECCFTGEEIKGLKALLTVNNGLIIDKQEKRTIKSYNMDLSSIEWLKQESQKQGKSTSDIINAALRRAMGNG